MGQGVEVVRPVVSSAVIQTESQRVSCTWTQWNRPSQECVMLTAVHFSDIAHRVHRFLMAVFVCLYLTELGVCDESKRPLMWSDVDVFHW